jgi:3-O-methylgallate 3,4-dioxygenase
LAFGAALREEICAYEQDLRVGFLASGGLSHFIVEEAMDRSIIEALKKKDFDTLAALRPEELMAGSSEIRNWLVVAEAARALDLTWVDYIPGYRTPALTGTGLCFAEWTSRS